MVGGLSKYLMRFADGILHQLGGVNPYVLPMYLQGDYRRFRESSFHANPSRNGHNNNQTPWGPFYPNIDSKKPGQHNEYRGKGRNHHYKPPKVDRSPIVVKDWFGKPMTFPYVPHSQFRRKR